jgi:hypothetical protein
MSAQEAIPAPEQEHNQAPEAAAAQAPKGLQKKPLLDLTKYGGSNAASAEGGTSGGTQTHIPLKEPGKNDFFRVHPDPNYHLYNVRVIEEEGFVDVYPVSPELVLPCEVTIYVSHVNFLTAISPHGEMFVWYFRNDTSWASSAMHVARRAQDEWVRIEADPDSGRYNIFTAPEPLRSKQPVFPKMSPLEVYTLAFDDRQITSVDAPVILSICRCWLEEQELAQANWEPRTGS